MDFVWVDSTEQDVREPKKGEGYFGMISHVCPTPLEPAAYRGRTLACAGLSDSCACGSAWGDFIFIIRTPRDCGVFFQSALSNVQMRSDNTPRQPSTGLAARTGLASMTNFCIFSKYSLQAHSS